MIMMLCLLCQDLDVDALKKHVEYLASDDMKGRDNNTDECRKAAQYVADQFKAAGLKPGGRDGTWFHDFETPFSANGSKKFIGRNVIGIVEGTDPELKKEYVVVNAHHDGLGIRQEKVHNGADDNGSGCAAVIEMAKLFAKKPCKRSVMFITFDCEEDGLLGSREFVQSKLYDEKSFAANVCFDVIGGNFLPWETERIYALGAESGLGDAVDKAAVKGLEVVRSGIYLIEPFGATWARSDYSAFRKAGVPFVFLSAGTPWTYHTEFDDVENMNFPKLAKAAAYASQVTQSLADGARPAFVEKPKTDVVAEAKVMKATVDEVIKRADEMQATAQQREALKTHAEKLAELVDHPDLKDARGRMQQAMVAVFQVVAHYRPKK